MKTVIGIVVAVLLWMGAAISCCGCGPENPPGRASAQDAALREVARGMLEDWLAVRGTRRVVRLEDALARLEVRLLQPLAWIDATRLCPHTGGTEPNANGCNFTDARYPACHVTACASASYAYFRNTPVIYLTEVSTADGHAAGVRHEMLHIIAYELGDGANAAGHADRTLWGPGGLVWRGQKRLGSDLRCAMGWLQESDLN